MTQKEAQKLKVGQEVRWKDGTPGKVLRVDSNYVVIMFEGDEGESYLTVDDVSLSVMLDKPKE